MVAILAAPHTKNVDRSGLSLSINNYSRASALLTKAQQVLKKARRSEESRSVQQIKHCTRVTAKLFAMFAIG
jgi:hypothetical protein